MNIGNLMQMRRADWLVFGVAKSVIPRIAVRRLPSLGRNKDGAEFVGGIKRIIERVARTRAADELLQIPVHFFRVFSAVVVLDDVPGIREAVLGRQVPPVVSGLDAMGRSITMRRMTPANILRSFDLHDCFLLVKTLQVQQRFPAERLPDRTCILVRGKCAEKTSGPCIINLES